MTTIAKIFMWLFVVVLGIEIGAGLYETLVVLPIWTASPPDTVIAYFNHNVANPAFVLNTGGRFWMFFTPMVGLLSITVLITAFWTRGAHRKWRLVAGALALIVVAATFAWFVPNIIKLNSEAVLTMPREHVASLANAWVTLNWVRVVVYLSAWFAGLKAYATTDAV